MKRHSSRQTGPQLTAERSTLVLAGLSSVLGIALAWIGAVLLPISPLVGLIGAVLGVAFSVFFLVRVLVLTRLVNSDLSVVQPARKLKRQGQRFHAWFALFAWIGFGLLFAGTTGLYAIFGTPLGSLVAAAGLCAGALLSVMGSFTTLKINRLGVSWLGDRPSGWRETFCAAISISARFELAKTQHFDTFRQLDSILDAARRKQARIEGGNLRLEGATPAVRLIDEISRRLLALGLFMLVTALISLLVFLPSEQLLRQTAQDFAAASQLTIASLPTPQSTLQPTMATEETTPEVTAVPTREPVTNSTLTPESASETEMSSPTPSPSTQDQSLGADATQTSTQATPSQPSEDQNGGKGENGTSTAEAATPSRAPEGQNGGNGGTTETSPVDTPTPQPSQDQSGDAEESGGPTAEGAMSTPPSQNQTGSGESATQTTITTPSPGQTSGGIDGTQTATPSQPSQDQSSGGDSSGTPTAEATASAPTPSQNHSSAGVESTEATPSQASQSQNDGVGGNATQSAATAPSATQSQTEAAAAASQPSQDQSNGAGSNVMPTGEASTPSSSSQDRSGAAGGSPTQVDATETPFQTSQDQNNAGENATQTALATPSQPAQDQPGSEANQTSTAEAAAATSQEGQNSGGESSTPTAEGETSSPQSPNNRGEMDENATPTGEGILPQGQGPNGTPTVVSTMFGLTGTLVEGPGGDELGNGFLDRTLMPTQTEPGVEAAPTVLVQTIPSPNAPAQRLEITVPPMLPLVGREANEVGTGTLTATMPMAGPDVRASQTTSTLAPNLPQQWLPNWIRKLIEKS